MRSLEEWTKYLEEQEQSLQQTLNKDDKSEKEPVQKTRTAVPVKLPLAEEPLVAAAPDKPAKSAKKAKEKAKGKDKAERVQSVQKPEPTPDPIPTADLQAAVRMRKKLPAQLITPNVEQAEVAQSSYTSFRETREDLLHRLLDPQLSLEDAARVLNVCPTTVRRYTNRGLLRHFRTAGNQRRFKLSDVLEFMERQNLGEIEE